MARMDARRNARNLTGFNPGCKAAVVGHAFVRLFFLASDSIESGGEAPHIYESPAYSPCLLLARTAFASLSRTSTVISQPMHASVTL